MRGGLSEQSGLICLALVAKLLKLQDKTLDCRIPRSFRDLSQLESQILEWSMQSVRLADWPDVDSALSRDKPVILVGDAQAQRAHGKRLGIYTEGVTFLVVTRKVSTVFPTTGGPFATDTVSYLAHEPHYPKENVWLCLGELRGFCEAAPTEDSLGIALQS